MEVKIGKIVVCNKGEILTSSGIGSCVVITLYDPRNRIGGLAHTMLPSQEPPVDKSDARYVNIAIDEMLKKMQALGAVKENLEAKIIGGANMFSSFKSNIGEKNINSAKEKLKKENILIAGMDCGGSQGRSVEFSVSSGIVTVKTKF